MNIQRGRRFSGAASLLMRGVCVRGRPPPHLRVASVGHRLKFGAGKVHFSTSSSGASKSTVKKPAGSRLMKLVLSGGGALLVLGGVAGLTLGTPREIEDVLSMYPSLRILFDNPITRWLHVAYPATHSLSDLNHQPAKTHTHVIQPKQPWSNESRKASASSSELQAAVLDIYQAEKGNEEKLKDKEASPGKSSRKSESSPLSSRFVFEEASTPPAKESNEKLEGADNQKNVEDSSIALDRRKDSFSSNHIAKDTKYEASHEAEKARFQREGGVFDEIPPSILRDEDLSSPSAGYEEASLFRANLELSHEEKGVTDSPAHKGFDAPISADPAVQFFAPFPTPESGNETVFTYTQESPTNLESTSFTGSPQRSKSVVEGDTLLHTTPLFRLEEEEGRGEPQDATLSSLNLHQFEAPPIDLQGSATSKEGERSLLKKPQANPLQTPLISDSLEANSEETHPPSSSFLGGVQMKSKAVDSESSTDDGESERLLFGGVPVEDKVPAEDAMIAGKPQNHSVYMSTSTGGLGGSSLLSQVEEVETPDISVDSLEEGRATIFTQEDASSAENIVLLAVDERPKLGTHENGSEVSFSGKSSDELEEFAVNTEGLSREELVQKVNELNTQLNNNRKFHSIILKEEIAKLTEEMTIKYSEKANSTINNKLKQLKKQQKKEMQRFKQSKDADFTQQMESFQKDGLRRLNAAKIDIEKFYEDRYNTLLQSEYQSVADEMAAMRGSLESQKKSITESLAVSLFYQRISRCLVSLMHSLEDGLPPAETTTDIVNAIPLLTRNSNNFILGLLSKHEVVPRPKALLRDCPFLDKPALQSSFKKLYQESIPKAFEEPCTHWLLKAISCGLSFLYISNPTAPQGYTLLDYERAKTASQPFPEMIKYQRKGTRRTLEILESAAYLVQIGDFRRALGFIQLLDEDLRHHFDKWITHSQTFIAVQDYIRILKANAMCVCYSMHKEAEARTNNLRVGKLAGV